MNQSNNLKKFLLLIVLMLVIVLGIYFVNKLFFSQTTVSFQPGQNNSISIFNIKTKYTFSTNHSLKKSIPIGLYTVSYQSNNPNYATVKKIINISNPLKLNTPELPYSSSYLDKLLIQEQPSIKQAFLSSSDGQLVTKNYYSFSILRLVGKRGDWSLIKLIPSNILNQNTLGLIMKKTPTSWTIITKPSIFLSSQSYPQIPFQYISLINQIPVATGLVASSTKQALMSIANQYLQAYETRDNSYQNSDYSWVNSLRGVLTNSFYNQLITQYTTVSSTGLYSSNYQTSHQNNFKVIPSINNCLIQPDTSNQFTVGCNVSNIVVNNKTNQLINKNNIPFGYTLNGQQSSVSITIINQNNQYQIISATN